MTAQAIKLVFGVLIGLVGFAAILKMLAAELMTGTNHQAYFQWAFYAGIIFVAAGVGMAMVDGDDVTQTQFEEESSR